MGISDSLVLRPVVTKSFIKGTIVVAIFSVFLELGPKTFVNYLIFLGLYYAALGYYIFSKHSSLYTVDDSGITLKSLLRAPRHVDYSNILDISIAQGRMAKRFNCGSIFLVLKERRGSVTVFGGGSAEVMRDVRSPQVVVDEISARLSPFGGPGGTADELR